MPCAVEHLEIGGDKAKICYLNLFTILFLRENLFTVLDAEFWDMVPFYFQGIRIFWSYYTGVGDLYY